jgi:hypothetical protein
MAVAAQARIRWVNVPAGLGRLEAAGAAGNRAAFLKRQAVPGVVAEEGDVGLVVGLVADDSHRYLVAVGVGSHCRQTPRLLRVGSVTRTVRSVIALITPGGGAVATLLDPGQVGAADGRHAVLHLENVPTELHAVTIRDGLFFPNYFTGWEDGQPLDQEAAGYAKTLLNQLDWWARAPHTARAGVPYPGGA